MTHNINWNIDMAKVLAIILIFLLLLLGYKQIDITNKLNKIENKIETINNKINIDPQCINQVEEAITKENG